MSSPDSAVSVFGDVSLPVSGMLDIEEWMHRCRQDEDLELEVRLGKTCRHSFRPGVTRDHMHRLVKEMLVVDNVTPLQPDNQWEECEDYFFLHKERRLRTRVSFEDAALTSSTVCKTVLDSIIFTTHSCDVRVSLCRESHVPPSDLPHTCTTQYVRLKQRLGFDVTSSPFRVDCSIVWSAPTRSEAERLQSGVEPVFEVECEFTPHRTPTTHSWCAKYPDTEDGNRKLAASMMLKVSDLMMTSPTEFRVRR